MANYSRVGMQELDQKLSRVVEAARIRPVSVFRYGLPWVWIVSQEAWQKMQMDIHDFLPLEHPLINLKEKLLDTDLRRFIEPRCKGRASEINAGTLICTMVLWASKKYTGSATELYHQINYNLLYRWFIGLEMHQKMWPEETFVHGISVLKNNDQVMQEIERVIDQSKMVDRLTTQ